MPFGHQKFNKVLKFLFDSLNDQGYVIFSAAGNNGHSYGTINFPANLSSVISVSSSKNGIV